MIAEPIVKIPPLAKGKHFLMGHTFRFLANPLSFLSKAATQGRVVHMQIGGRNMYLLSHPDDLKRVMVDNHTNYVKSEAYKVIQRMLGNGLLNSEGDFWRRQRKLMMPAFHIDKLAGMSARMAQRLESMLSHWQHTPGHSPINISGEMMRITLELVSDALFSSAVGDDDVQKVNQYMEDLLRYSYAKITSPIKLPPTLPTPLELRYRRAENGLNQIIYRIISKRKANSGHFYNDLLAMLMAAQDEESQTGMTDTQLRDELMTLFLAGHETSANALCWAFYLLDKHPEVQEKLRSEILNVTNSEIPSFGQLSQMPYLQMVTQEVLRLYPTAWVIGRKALDNDRVGGFLIPADSTVIVSPYVMHRHPDYWQQPESFIPERFADDETKKMAQPGKFRYFPFGGGQRLCIGYHFALLEISLVLAMILPNYRLHLPKDTKVTPEPLITLRPKNGLKMHVKPVH